MSEVPLELLMSTLPVKGFTAPEVLGKEGYSNSENEMLSQSKMIVTLVMRVWTDSSV